MGKWTYEDTQNRKNGKKKVFKGDYYVGLDVGSASVGWAVSDTDYHIPNFNNKAMWGARLFEEAQTAAQRRTNRCARRRLKRRKDRLHILQSLFAEEIAKVDFEFFMRLKASGFLGEDKGVSGLNSYFNDKDYTDVDFHREYPTIYHLRHALATSDEPHDIRLVYLAIHHILKHRGHFLLNDEFSDLESMQIEPYLESLKDRLSVDFDLVFTCSDIDILKKTLSSNDGVKAKTGTLKHVLEASGENSKPVLDSIITILSKGKCDLTKLFQDSSLVEDDKPVKISFADGIDDKEDFYRTLLGDRFDFILLLKSIYDWGMLQNLLRGKRSISEAKVAIYEEHKQDLCELKSAVQELIPNEYEHIFGKPTNKNIDNYTTYIGSYSRKGKKEQNSAIEKNSSCEELCKSLRKLFENTKDILQEKYPKLAERMDNNSLLPKQKVKDNGIIPYQLHHAELIDILDHAEGYLPFLKQVDEQGITIRQKIESLLTFRIPYYVGPLNNYKNQNAWAVYKENASGKVYPWNFEEKIDVEESACKFITRMTNKCTYVSSEDVLPKNSLLYNKFLVLNELNNLRIDDIKISLALKQEIFTKVFMNNKKVTLKKLMNWLISEGYVEKDISDKAFTGIDKGFANSLAVYADFKRIFDVDVLTKEQEEIAEIAILNITLFGDDRKMLKRRLQNIMGSRVSQEKIKKMAKLKYSGWGRLSAAFLQNIKGRLKKSDDKEVSIITALYENENNPNLMHLLSNDYTYIEEIEEKNNALFKEQSLNDILEELYVSPAVKRSIHQSLGIMKELTDIMGKAPARIFIEMARGADGSGRTVTRKEQLEALYKNCEAEAKKINNQFINKERQSTLKAQIENYSVNQLQGKKLFLYYMQMGRCMYSGEKIDLANLQKDYDIEHIYPRSLVKDDSLNNIVLVKRTLNAEKSNTFPISDTIRNDSQVKQLWYYLLKLKFITKDKYNRLTRSTPFTSGELEGFISRQLVETRQSTKALASILQKIYPDTEIVYVKAGNVSDFRHGIEDIQNLPNVVNVRNEIRAMRKQENEMLKSRSINNFHHGKDAYLNIVVGNVYYTKFTSSPYRFIKERLEKKDKKHEKTLYSLNTLYRKNVERNGQIAWVPSIIDEETGELKEGTMSIVKKYMKRDNLCVTRATYEGHGELFDLNPLGKGKGQAPLKGTGPLADIDKYGGYNKLSTAYFFLVEYEQKNKRKKCIETMLCVNASKIKTKDDLLAYCKEKIDWKNPRILIPKIKIGTLLEEDGFRMRVTGRSNDKILINNANELILPDTIYAYVRFIDKQIAKVKENDKYQLEESMFDAALNEATYKLFVEKMKTNTYKLVHGKRAIELESYFDKFLTLSTVEQAKVLLEILAFFDTTASSSNLSLIGGKAHVGILGIGKNIIDRNIYVVYTSKTGLFERKVFIGDL